MKDSCGDGENCRFCNHSFATDVTVLEAPAAMPKFRRVVAGGSLESGTKMGENRALIPVQSTFTRMLNIETASVN
jgi:hypothetical protein